MSVWRFRRTFVRPGAFLLLALVGFGVVVGILLFTRVPSALAIHARDAVITFRQFEIQSRDDELGRLSFFERVVAHLSVRTIPSPAAGVTVSLEPAAIEETAGAMFRVLPTFIVVWPTEGYYYFRIEEAARSFAGNFRFTDIEDGVASFAIYPLDESSATADTPRSAAPQYGYVGLTPEKGFIARRLYRDLYAVEWRGRTIYLYLDPPDRRGAIAPPLRPSEELVSWLRDESGVRFFLLYDRVLKSFLYILDETVPPFESLAALGALRRGEVSGFAFYEDSDMDRKVLVGIQRSAQESNSYFDGPFDQVPGRLSLRDRIYEAYPYLKLSGVDEWGYFCGTRGVRIAITPYQSYSSDDELLDILASCSRQASDFAQKVNCLTFDTKQVNHFQSKAFDRSGALTTLPQPRTCELQSVKNVVHAE